MKPRVVVFAYSEVGYACLECLIQAGVHIVAVFSHEDNPSETQWFRSVPKLAQAHNIPLFTPASLKGPEWLECMQRLKPDLIFSFYYRQMIRMALLDLAPLGAYNIHGSLLPKYRGRASIHWAVLKGEQTTGATLHVMVKEADAGDIIDQEPVAILGSDNALSVSHKVASAAVQVLGRQLPSLLKGTAVRHPQDHSQATVFGGRTPEDGRINWDDDARTIHNLIRSVNRPFPGAFADLNSHSRLKIWESSIIDYPSQTPRKILSLDPFIIATGHQGALHITDYTWIDPTTGASISPPVLSLNTSFL